MAPANRLTAAPGTRRSLSHYLPIRAQRMASFAYRLASRAAPQDEPTCTFPLELMQRLLKWYWEKPDQGAVVPKKCSIEPCACGCGDQPMTRYITEIPSNVDPNAPLVYRFTIPALDVVHHGKARNGAQCPRTDYGRNIERMLQGLPRTATPGQERYRLIHHAMHQAVRGGHIIVLTLVENCEPADLVARERWWIAHADRPWAGHLEKLTA
jgi:hypothetical protein